MDKNELKSVNGSTIVMYTNEDGVTNLDVRLENETVWLSVEQMTILFGRDRTVITRHINKIFKEGELDETLVCAKFAHTKEYGRRKGFLQNQKIPYYNLDVIISVGYRVKSIQGTHFRQWAQTHCRQYIGSFNIDDSRIKV